MYSNKFQGERMVEYTKEMTQVSKKIKSQIVLWASSCRILLTWGQFCQQNWSRFL